MRNFTWIVGLFLLIGCSAPKVEKSTDFTIEGKISNCDSETIVLIKNTLTKDVRDTFPVKDCAFTLQQKLDAGGYYTLIYNKERITLFLQQGDLLKISFDADDLENSINFTGTAAAANKLIADLAKLNAINFGNPKTLYKADEEAFNAKIDSMKEVLNERIDKFVKENPSVDKEFIEFERASVLYAWANKKANFKMYHAYLTKDDSFEVSENFNDYLKKVDFNNSSLISLEMYRAFILNYHNILAQEKEEENSPEAETDAKDALDISLQLANENFENETIREFVKYSVIHDYIKYSGIKALDGILNKFKAECKNKDFTASLDEQYKKWQHLKAGNPAPDFKYFTPDSNEVSLSSLKGKYVYIDIWATWCGPCVREIPEMKKLIEKFAGKNVAFVGVSLDDTRQTWHKMVVKNELKGIQLYAGGWSSSIAQDYNVNSIPRFVLVGTEGEIIDVNAPRPSENIAEILNGLEKI